MFSTKASSTPTQSTSDRFATFDVGTNSVLMLVVEARPDGHMQQIRDRARVTRLGQGLDASGCISDEAARRTLDCLKEFTDEARELQVSARAAVGTLCLRVAANADDFVRRAADELDLAIEIIPGEEEARLTWLGVMQDLPEEAHQPAVFDVGGGSTELIFGSRSLILSRQSLETGASRVTEAFLDADPPDSADLHALLNHLEAGPFEHLESEAFDTLYGVGGTATSLAAMELGLSEYDAAQVQGLEMERRQVASWMERLRTATLAGRKTLPGLDPARADVILGGVAVIYGLLRRLGADRFTVSVRGLRHGLMAARFGPRAA